MIDFRLYLVSDRRLIRGGSDETIGAESVALAAALETACRAGVRAIQIREKDLDAKTLHAMVCRVRDVTGGCRAKLFVNDRVDVAMATGADGVHCPERGFPVPDAVRLLGPSRHVGASTHSLARAQQAEGLGADFITFGPVFSTPSKTAYGAPQGLKALGEVAEAVAIPVFAIGGITPERAAPCLDRGASGVALISSILAADDIARAVDDFTKVMGTL
jgi:thiamine-phosphate pyrophosphorylase